MIKVWKLHLKHHSPFTAPTQFPHKIKTETIKIKNLLFTATSKFTETGIKNFF